MIMYSYVTDILLSTLVYLIVEIDKEIYGFLKMHSTKQPDNHIFLHIAAITSIHTMLLAP